MFLKVSHFKFYLNLFRYNYKVKRKSFNRSNIKEKTLVCKYSPLRGRRGEALPKGTTNYKLFLEGEKMLTITIQPQPISVDLDMLQVEGFNEDTNELKAFSIETKIVTEDVDGVEFSTTKSYDKKYIFDLSADATAVAKLKDVINGVSASLTLAGEVTSNTEATLKAVISTVSANA